MSADDADTLDFNEGVHCLGEKKQRQEEQKKREEAERKVKEEAKAEADRKAEEAQKVEKRKKKAEKAAAAKPALQALQASGSGGKAKGKGTATRKALDIDEDEEDEVLAEKKAKRDPVSRFPVGAVNANFEVVCTLRQIEHPLHRPGYDGRLIAPVRHATHPKSVVSGEQTLTDPLHRVLLLRSTILPSRMRGGSWTSSMRRMEPSTTF
jgi:hypothetical protein